MTSKVNPTRLGIKLYRLLLRKSRKADKNPALKAFIVADRHLFYNPWSMEASFWQSTNNENDHSNRISNEFRLLCRKFCGYGMYYLPPPAGLHGSDTTRDCVPSLSLFIRECFDPPQSPTPTPTTAAVYSYDVAFEAMRYLDHCLRIARNFTVQPQQPTAVLPVSVAAVLMPARIQKKHIMKYKDYKGKLLISHPVSSVAEAQTVIQTGSSVGGSTGTRNAKEDAADTDPDTATVGAADTDTDPATVDAATPVPTPPTENLVRKKLWQTNNIAHILSQSVILVIDNGTEDLSTTGLVVNKPLDCTVKEVRNISPAYSDAMSTMFPGIELLDDCLLYRGGIVYPEESAIFVLHTCSELAQHSHVVTHYTDGEHQRVLYYTQNLNMVGLALTNGSIPSPAAVQVYYGCMGWGPSQLSGEVNMNTWVAAEPAVSYEHDEDEEDEVVVPPVSLSEHLGGSSPTGGDIEGGGDRENVVPVDPEVLAANRIIVDIVFGQTNNAGAAMSEGDSVAAAGTVVGGGGYECWRTCLAALGGEYPAMAAGIVNYETLNAAAGAIAIGDDVGGTTATPTGALDADTRSLQKAQRKELRTLSKFGIDGWNGV